MKFTFDRDAMIKEISIAQEIVTNKSLTSILSNILLVAENNVLTILATDSTTKFSTTLPVEIQEEGSTTIYCDKFMNILSQSPAGEIEFILDDRKVTIKPAFKKIKFEVKSQVSEKFPDLRHFVASEDVPFFEVSAKDFKEMILHTSFSVSTDKNRYFMNGQYFIKDGEYITMVSTDGRRLSFINKPAYEIPDFKPAIIPTKILSIVQKHASDEGNIQIAVVDSAIFIKFGNYEFSSLLIDGQFPKYKHVVPDELDNKFIVNKSDLDAALKRTTIMVDKKVSRILFNITSGVLKVISPESDMGSADEEIPCRYDGPDILIAMNYTYVTDPLKVINSENILFKFKAEDGAIDGHASVKKAIIMTSDVTDEYSHLIMPMQDVKYI